MIPYGLIRQPTRQPTSQPSRQPTSRPSNPSGQPTRKPSGIPTGQPTSKPSYQPVKRIDTGLIVAVTSITGLAFLFMLFSVLDGVFRPKLTEDEKHRACLKYIIDSWGYRYHPVARNGIQRPSEWNRRDGRESKDDDGEEDREEGEENDVEQEEVEQHVN